MVLPVTDLHGALNQDLQAYAGTQLTGTVTAYGTAPTGNVFGVNAFVTNTITVAGNKTNNNAAPGATNFGTLPAIVAPSNTTFPTYTTGDQVALVTDLSGNTNVDVQYWGGVDLGAAANFGTTPGAVVVPGVNASLFIGTTVATAAAAGVQLVGISGATGATLDAAITAGTAPTNAIATLVQTLVTAPTLTNAQTIITQADVTGSTFVNNDGRKKTYSAFATWTPVAGDICIMPGNATNIVRVHRVEVSMSTTGTAGVEQVQLIKRSTADTGGTSAAMTAVPHDSAFPAGVSIPHNYTVAPTLGTAVGPIRGVQFFDETNAATGANTWLWTFGDGRGGAAAIVLRGAAQQLNVNLAGVIATQTVTVSYEWTEE
jgi:hypothetical protein